jgi:hypothetical protein
MCVSWKSVQEILLIFFRRNLSNEPSVLRSELEATYCNKRYIFITTTEVDFDVSKNMLCLCSKQKIETVGTSDLHGVTTYITKI